MSKTDNLYCSGCRLYVISKNSTFKTCDKCRKIASLRRNNSKKNKIECKGTKENGQKCTNKVSPKCKNKYWYLKYLN